MAIHYLERHEIDTEKWDSCLASNPVTDSFFARSWYLDVACEQWGALVLDDYVSLMPLPWRKKHGIHYVYPPFFLPRLGVFGKDSAANELKTWLDAIPEKFRWIDIVLHEQHQQIDNTYKCILHSTYALDCSLPYEEIQKNYHKNHKRNCQKASEEDLMIVNNFFYEEAINLFRENQAKLFKVGYQQADYVCLTKILKRLSEQQQLEQWGVTDANGRLCATAFFPFLNGKYYFLFSGRNSDSTRSRAMFFLIDKFIQQHAGKYCMLDFNGSDNVQVAKFYAGFGAVEKSFCQLQISRLHPWLKKMFLLYRKLR